MVALQVFIYILFRTRTPYFVAACTPWKIIYCMGLFYSHKVSYAAFATFRVSHFFQSCLKRFSSKAQKNVIRRLCGQLPSRLSHGTLIGCTSVVQPLHFTPDILCCVAGASSVVLVHYEIARLVGGNQPYNRTQMQGFRRQELYEDDASRLFGQPD